MAIYLVRTLPNSPDRVLVRNPITGAYVFDTQDSAQFVRDRIKGDVDILEFASDDDAMSFVKSPEVKHV